MIGHGTPTGISFQGNSIDRSKKKSVYENALTGIELHACTHRLLTVSFPYSIFDFKLLVNFKKRNDTERENEANTISTFIEMILSPDNLFDSIENENGTEIE